MDNKGKPKTAEEIRAERIANLKDPKALAVIAKIEQERNEKLAELRIYQRANFDKWVEQVARQRGQYLNGPRHDPPGHKQGPVIDKDDQQKLRDDAKAEVLRQTKNQERATNMLFDRRTDRELDAADRALGHDPIDRSDR
jgi:hypothetical protein